MGNEEKLQTSLYNNIKSYVDATELLENLIQIFESYFGRSESEGDILTEIQHIVEHKTYDFYNFKHKILQLFHCSLIKGKDKSDYNIQLDKKELFAIGDEVKKVLENNLFLYQHEFILEFTSFINKGEASLQLKEDFKTLTKECFSDKLQELYKGIELSEEKVKLVIEDKIHDYEVFLWTVKKLLLDLQKERETLEEKVYVDKVLAMRETFITTTENLKEDLIKDITFIVISYFVKKIRETLLVGMEDRLYNYRNTLKQYLNFKTEGCQEVENVKLNHKNAEPSEIEFQVYSICRELFICQYNYLSKIFSLCKTKFDTLTSEVKFNLDVIFNGEFEEPIYFINTYEDFNNICDIFNEKLHVILYTFTINTFNEFKKSYYDYLMEKLSYKKESLEKMYCHKLILDGIDYINCYSQDVKIKLCSKLEELYKSYSSEEILKDNSLNLIINFYKVREDIPKVFFREYIYSDIDYQTLFSKESFNQCDSLEDKKLLLYNKVVGFKNKLWDTLYNELITYFDYILPNIGKNMDHAKKQSDYYKVKAEEPIL
ncbi:hypothetical protein [Clostridium tunisiense]|uniref:hypothetical protein n=1 Tax=Clostridium tunisiense TaxID=219748 RepID=UPI0002E8EE87|nr:hypothetical protein [Clostridium tunisiense]